MRCRCARSRSATPGGRGGQRRRAPRRSARSGRQGPSCAQPGLAAALEMQPAALSVLLRRAALGVLFALQWRSRDESAFLKVSEPLVVS